MRHPLLFRAVAVLVSLAVLVAACSGDDEEATPPGNEGTVVAGDGVGPIQDLWVLTRLQTVGPDGVIVDLTEALVGPLQEGAGDPIELADGVTFRPTPGLGATIVDARGQVRQEVEVDVGLLEHEDELGLVVLASPDLDRGGQVDGTDELVVDLDLVADQVVDGRPLITDYVFAITVPAEDDAVAAEEAALDGLDLLAARLERRALRYTALDEGGEPLGIAGQVGEIAVGGDDGSAGSGGASAGGSSSAPDPSGGSGDAEGAAGAQVVLVGSGGGGASGGIPPKAQPMMEGLGKGFVKCARSFGSLSCVRKFFQTFGKGAADSLGNIDQQLSPDPPPPPPSCTFGCGGSSGEPHLRTFDGTRYDLQTAGELVAARSEGIEVQLRTEPWAGSTAVSVNTAAAIGIGDQRLTVTLADEEPVRLDGETVALDDLVLEPVVLDAGGTAEVRQGTLVVRVDGFAAVWVHGLDRGHLDVYLDPAGPDSTWEGVFGDLDGDAANDLIPQTGGDPIDPQDAEALYDRFADSWRVTDETSLFDYAEGESTETFTDRSFPSEQVAVDTLDPVERGVAELVCRAAQIADPVTFDACVLDYALTGDVEYVQGAQMGDAVAQVVEGDLVPGDLATAVIDLGGTEIDGLEWLWQVDGRELVEDRGGELATGEGIAVVRSRDDQDGTYLTAIELDTGEQRWEVPDVATSCRPVVTSAGVVAQVRQGTPAAGEGDDEDVVLLDLETGEVRGTWVPDGGERLAACELALTALDDGTVVLVDPSERVRALDTDGDLLTERWAIPSPRATLGWAPVVDGAPHRMVRDDAAEKVLVERLAPATGAVEATLEVPGIRAFSQDVDALQPLTGELLAVVKAGPAAGEPDAIIVLRTGDELSVVWTRAFGEGEELGRRPTQLAVADGLVGGWTDDDGEAVAALDLDTGELAWTAPTSSFDNSDDQISGVDGIGFLVSPFGGAWLEALDDGEQTWSIDEIAGLESPATHTPYEGRLLVSGSTVDDGAGRHAFVALVPLDR